MDPPSQGWRGEGYAKWKGDFSGQVFIDVCYYKERLWSQTVFTARDL